jgi:hypothetical protein
MNLGFRLTEFFGQLLVAFYGIRMTAFPIAHVTAKFPDLATQLPQFPLYALQSGTVCTGNKRPMRLVGEFQKRGTHGPTLYPD